MNREEQPTPFRSLPRFPSLSGFNCRTAVWDVGCGMKRMQRAIIYFRINGIVQYLSMGDWQHHLV